MAGLGGLASIIYHEKQQAGSMLCAQHALNSLLQENYFTAPDLSDIARNLDLLEESYDDNNTGASSTNMDDTGFFSVQVLDNALKVWGLNLTRWRGEEMRPYQDHPHTQLAFILNLEQHWFTLRRFGDAVPNMDRDLGDGHWFNLNSFLPEPEWVGKLYLGMVLQQSEEEGYSVFAVTQADPSAPLALPRTEADAIASTLPEPTSAGRPNLHASRMPPPTAQGRLVIEGLEDEDYELQAALQASLSGGEMPEGRFEHPPLSPPRLSRAPVPLPPSDPPSRSGSGLQMPTQYPSSYPVYPASESIDASGSAEPDPVAASLERNKRMLQRMKAEQEYAQRELWAEGGGIPEAAERRRREEEEEAEELRRAIEESEALARDRRNRDEGEDEDEDVDMDAPHAGLSATRNPYPSVHSDRVYDDDDTELQAALKASLEHVPEGWQPPGLQLPLAAPPSMPTSGNTHDAGGSINKDTDDSESVMSDETSTAENPPSNAIQAESVSVDELRKRRLAKFS